MALIVPALPLGAHAARPFITKAHANLGAIRNPSRFRIDATHGHQSADPEKRFNSIGMRLLF